jgi:hypothetical protein
MILFEANAVAPLVNLPDAAVEETVQWEIGVKRVAGHGLGQQRREHWGAGGESVYNARNLFARSQLLLNDYAIWRQDGYSCSD